MELYAIHKNFAVSYLEAIGNATAEERAAAIDRYGDQALPDVLAISEDGREATISIVGPLSPKGPSALARFFGYEGTAYSDIVESAQLLEDDPTVETVRLMMNTPGGMVDGMDQARQAIKNLAAAKTVIAENHGMIASAGYHIATAATRIEALSPLAMTGSIGVIIAGYDTSKMLKKAGVKKVRIVSKNAPNKAPDASTDHGLELLQAEADAMERVFIAAVAEGRGTTEQDVIENFGKGGILIAQDPDESKPSALKAGMIDAVKTTVKTSNTGGAGDDPNHLAAVGGGQQEDPIMDLSALQTEHPALYAQVVASGVEQGVAQERERVAAHATMGESSGDMVLAMACIKDGSDLNQSITAQYLSAGMNAAAVAARAGETEGDLDTEAAGADTADTVLAKAVAEELGVEYDV